MEHERNGKGRKIKQEKSRKKNNGSGKNTEEEEDQELQSKGKKDLRRRAPRAEERKCTLGKDSHF